ncbi:cholinesterase 1-like [Dermatophagoides farinae]|uniref:Carboxylic ester hydrolase n=1 Tax=Dermatophagoides farinae TaxID=6954 RepID=A0A9D4NSF8_DERFA|nr:cholinesterase 1-like [Dermatophagoides farinae]
MLNHLISIIFYITFILLSFFNNNNNNKIECTLQQPRYAPIINLEHYGRVRGIIENVPIIDSNHNEDIYFYQAIRYGKAKRFERPERADSWSNDVYDAIKPRYACPQVGYNSSSMSEDCLYANVWTSVRALASIEKPLPVMVWIHGGAFKVGSIFQDLYNGGIFVANGDVVVVSIAYRLGAFGFLYTGDDPELARGNQGLYDQILGLQWVRDNIHNFGGDPNQVTVFGESAGSMSVGSLIISPLANGLFQRAIMQSGAPNPNVCSNSKADELSNGLAMEKTMECLRNKTIEEILATDSPDMTTPFVPIYGDDFMPLNPVEALKSGQGLNQVDLMFGVTRDEGELFLQKFLPDNKKATIHQVQDYMRIIFIGKPFVEEVIEFYTKNLNEKNVTLAQLRHALSDVFGDYSLICPTILFGEEYFQRFHNVEFYSYRLMAPIKSIHFLNDTWGGVGHAADLFYMFGQPFQMKNLKFTQQEKDLSRDMIKAWIRFAQNQSFAQKNDNC